MNIGSVWLLILWLFICQVQGKYGFIDFSCFFGLWEFSKSCSWQLFLIMVYCTAQAINGNSCMDNLECTSGFCMQGFCCDDVCGYENLSRLFVDWNFQPLTTFFYSAAPGVNGVGKQKECFRCDIAGNEGQCKPYIGSQCGLLPGIFFVCFTTEKLPRC